MVYFYYSSILCTNTKYMWPICSQQQQQQPNMRYRVTTSASNLHPTTGALVHLHPPALSLVVLWIAGLLRTKCDR